MPRGVFDSEAFYAAIDGVRQSRKLRWNEVAKKSGVSASSLTRMAQGRRPDVDSLASLVSWSGLSADDFILHEEDVDVSNNSLAIATAQFRADKNLNDEGKRAIEATLKALYEQLRGD